MRRFSAAMVLLAGCASSGAYTPGAATTVPEPVMTVAGPPARPPRAALHAEPPAPPVEQPTQVASDGNRFSRWLKSGRGWTWGKADHGPARDPGLDRLMVDTLSSGQPSYSREPIATAGSSNQSWARAPTAVAEDRLRPANPMADASDNRGEMPPRTAARTEADRRPSGVPARYPASPSYRNARESSVPTPPSRDWRPASPEDSDEP